MISPDRQDATVYVYGEPVVMPRPRVRVTKVLRFERWRVIAIYRRYRGLGHPKFEFEFRIGWKRMP